MLKPQLLETLASVLVNAGKAEVVGAVPQADETMVLDIELDGRETISLSIGDLRLVHGDLEKLSKVPRDLRGRYNRVKRATELSIHELRARNLPLYWNKAWLLKQLAEHRSYAVIAREFNFPSATTIASFAKRNHGIDVQSQFDQKRVEVIQRYKDAADTDEPLTHVQLAKDFDVAVATVYRWLQEDAAGLTPDPNRVHKRRGRGQRR
jgi:hypothetical protein